MSAYALQSLQAMFHTNDDSSSQTRHASGMPFASLSLPRTAMASLELIAFVAVCFALFQIREVVVPVAFAGLAVLAVYPMHRGLRDRIGRPASVGVCFVGVTLVLAALIAMIVLCFSQVTESLSSLSEVSEAFDNELPAWLATFVDIPSGESLGQRVFAVVRGGLQASIGTVLALAFFILVLLDADRLVQRVRANETCNKLADATTETAENIRHYLLARTVVGLMTGLAVALACWGLGIELFLVWGALNFLLNYIPTLGSILAVIPPVLFMWTTTGSPSEVLLVLGVVGGIQLVMGNYVDPLVQSRFVELSALGVLLSVVFWGWLWGIPGAFIGVPMTIALLMLCKRSSRYAWLHTALVAQSPTMPHLPPDD